MGGYGGDNLQGSGCRSQSFIVLMKYISCSHWGAHRSLGQAAVRFFKKTFTLSRAQFCWALTLSTSAVARLALVHLDLRAARLLSASAAFSPSGTEHLRFSGKCLARENGDKKWPWKATLLTFLLPTVLLQDASTVDDYGPIDTQIIITGCCYMKTKLGWLSVDLNTAFYRLKSTARVRGLQS